MNDITDRRLLAGVLIAAGVLWLLIASGFIPTRLLLTLLGFWPLLPIGIGLDLLLERKPFDVPFTALALLAMLVLAFALPGRGGAVEARLVEAIDGATRAEVRLELGSAPTTLHPLVGSDLFRADIVDRREVRYQVGGAVRRRIELAPGRGPGVGLGAGTPGRWDLRLATGLPLTLEVKAASGRLDLDLSGLDLEVLVLEGGSGSAQVTLPSTGRSYAVTAQLASGTSEIVADLGAELAIEVSSGSGPSRWTFPRGSRAVMNLHAGSGSVVIDVSDAAAIVLRVEDDGSGPLRLPPFLERLEGRGEQGVWRSAAAANAAPEIVIAITDAGSGSIEIR